MLHIKLFNPISIHPENCSLLVRDAGGIVATFWHLAMGTRSARKKEKARVATLRHVGTMTADCSESA